MRIVIDTNIWVSGLLWRGGPWKLLQLAEQGQIEICTSTAILSELAEVLTYDRLQPRLKQLGLAPSDLLAQAISLATVFEVQPGAPTVAADPDDDIFIWCAVTAQASYIVSGDHHLLALGAYMGIPIIRLAEFLVREFPHLSS